MIKESLNIKQRLINCLKIHYGIDVDTLILLPLGADMQASIYKAQAYDQSIYFIKLKHGHSHDISAIIITLLGDAGIQQIIPIVKTIHGQSTHHLDDLTLIVFPFIEGQDGFSRDFTEDQWYALGNVMRKIHEIDVPQSIQSRVRRETYSPKWRQAVRSLYPLIESKSSGDTIAVNLHSFMKKHMAEIHQLVDRAEHLSQKIQHQSPEFVLCHSDIHGGNVLMDGKDNIYIVDWDAPIMAPKERDLMFIGGGVANVWNKPHEEEWFYKGYGKAEVNMTLLAYYRHERILEDIAIYGEQLLIRTSGGKDRIKWYEQFISQFDPQGVVEIAFKTNKDLI